MVVFLCRRGWGRGGGSHVRLLWLDKTPVSPYLWMGVTFQMVLGCAGITYSELGRICCSTEACSSAGPDQTNRRCILSGISYSIPFHASVGVCTCQLSKALAFGGWLLSIFISSLDLGLLREDGCPNSIWEASLYAAFHTFYEVRRGCVKRKFKSCWEGKQICPCETECVIWIRRMEWSRKIATDGHEYDILASDSFVLDVTGCLLRCCAAWLTLKRANIISHGSVVQLWLKFDHYPSLWGPAYVDWTWSPRLGAGGGRCLAVRRPEHCHMESPPP